MGIDLPQILLYAYFKAKEQFDFEHERYDCGVLFLLTKGGFEFKNSEGNFTAVTAGEAVWCPPGFDFHRKATSPMELHMIKFRSDLSLPSATAVTVINDRVLSDLKAAAPAEFCQGDGIDALTRHYCTDACLETTNELISRQQKASDDLPPEVYDLLKNRFTENITNAKLCKMLSCSEATMIDRVRKATGKTPQQFITEKRLNLARRLLAETRETVSAIAERCGYADPLYFSRLFVKATGLTATEFRKKYRI